MKVLCRDGIDRDFNKLVVGPRAFDLSPGTLATKVLFSAVDVSCTPRQVRFYENVYAFESIFGSSGLSLKAFYARRNDLIEKLVKAGGDDSEEVVRGEVSLVGPTAQYFM